MKRILCFTLALCLLLPLLVACNSDDDTIRVGLLSGPTAMGALKMMEDADPRYTFKICKTPDEIRSELESGNLDVIALPTNLAATLYNKGTDLKVIALNTLGVLYIVDATGTVKTLEDLEGKTVYVPNAGSNPEYILRRVLKQHGINATVETKYTDAAVIQSAFVNGLENGDVIEIAALPQPAATATVISAKKAGKTVTAPIDLSAEWDEVESTPIAQGCLVATTDFLEENPGFIEGLLNQQDTAEKLTPVKEFLTDYEASVAYMTDPANLDAAAKLAVKHGILKAEPIAKQALPKCAITCKTGAEMKAALEAFYTILYDYNPAAVGGTVPASGFYYE